MHVTDAWKKPAKKVDVKASCRYRMSCCSGATASRSMDPITSVKASCRRRFASFA